MASKHTRRGFVRSAADGLKAWNAAKDAYQRAAAKNDRLYKALDAAPDGPEEDAALAAWRAAREERDQTWARLMSVPAPDTAALAYKILQHSDVPALDLPAEVARIAESGDDEEQAWLAIYLDAQRLAGIVEAAPVDPDGPTFLAWEAEAARLLADYAAQGDDLSEEEDEEASARLFDPALDLLRKILETPGQGATVAAVKLRTLLHPELGVATLLGQMGPDDAQGIYTALGAITGETPFNPFAWIAAYDDAGGRVRKVRIAFGPNEDDAKFGLLFSCSGAQAEPACRALHPQAEGQAWALLHAARTDVVAGGAARSLEEIERDERAEGRIVIAIVFPPIEGEG